MKRKIWGKIVGFDIEGRQVEEDGCFEFVRITPPDENSKPVVINIDSGDEEM